MEVTAWIAIAANVLIAGLGFWFNYKTNKENIKARRAEIATEKSIEAFREVTEKLQALFVDLFLDVNLDNLKIDEHTYGKAEKMSSDLYKTYVKYRLYFPEAISNDFFDLIRNAFVLPSLLKKSKEGEISDELFALLNKSEHGIDELIENMQKYIGLETEVEK